MASRKQAKARPARRMPSRSQMLWSGLSLLVLLGLVISTCAVPGTS
jgi:hypothetical protein